jgi:hypothetical protein
MIMPTNKTLTISWSDVERCDITKVAQFLDPDRFDAQELAELCGAVRLRFGHARQAEDVFAQPQARRFARTLNEWWPWAGFFLRCRAITAQSPREDVIDAGVLVAWALCHTDDLTFMHWEEPDVVGMRFNHDQLADAVDRLLAQAEQLCKRVGFSERAIGPRRKTVEVAIGSFFDLGEQQRPRKSR